MELGLVTLLRAAWVAAILPIVFALIPSSKLSFFQQFVLGFAKRGKIMQASSNKLSVPQKLFIHFYILAFVWTTLLLAATWLYAYSTTPKISEPLLFSSIASHLTGGSHIFSLQRSHTSKEHRSRIAVSIFLLLLMEAQVLRRLFESIYVFKYSPSARMHILGYLTGLFFYTAVPISLCCNHATEVYKFGLSLIQEFIVKGKDRMLVAEVDWWRFLNPLMQLRWYSWMGAAIFCWGWIHQCHCHAILGSLRENREDNDDYVVPYGDWFQYVSSPHYLAEIVTSLSLSNVLGVFISRLNTHKKLSTVVLQVPLCFSFVLKVIYAAFVVASGCSDLTIWLLWGFTVANLVLAAAETHRWYLHKFDNYPRNRFAIFPFVY